MTPIFFSQAAPFSFAPETSSLFVVIQKGGPLMWLMLVGSIVGLTVFVERWLYFRSNHISVGEFLLGINTSLKNKKYQEALERCDEGNGPVVRVVRQAIIARNLPPSELREVVKEVAQMQLPRLDDNLSILATIGQVMPLIGLLGTVSGMIEAFNTLNRAAGAASVSDIASGIWTALITTAAGLAVAIPCDVAYSYLVSRMNSLIADMERAGIEVIHVLTEAHKVAVTSPVPEPVTATESMTLLPPEKKIPNPAIPNKQKAL